MSDTMTDYSTGDHWQTSDNLLRWSSEPVKLTSEANDPLWAQVMLVVLGALIFGAGVLVGAFLP